MSRFIGETDAEALVVLAASADGLGLSGLARATGRAPSTVQRALRRLEGQGAIARSRDPRPRYRLASEAPREALCELARWALPPGRVATLEAQAQGPSSPEELGTRLTAALSDPRRARRLRSLARRLIWWERAGAVLRRPSRLVAQAMVLGTWENVEFLRGIIGDEGFAAVLDAPPMGVFDRRSWAYWHARLGRDEVIPALPKRVIA